jgi:biotin carboxyl carrier protein
MAFKTILDNGKLRKVAKHTEVDYHIPSGSDFLSSASNLIPGIGGVSGGRVLLGDKASVQAISLVNRETPLVQSIPTKESKTSFEEHFGKNLTAIFSPKAGTVHKLDKDELVLKDHDGKEHSIELYENFNSGKKSFMHHTPVVKEGDVVKKDQLLATSNFSDKHGNLALGVNLNTAIMPYRSNNFEDAFVVTETGAKKLTAEQLITTRLDRRLGVDTKKDTYISLFPNKFYNNQLSTLDSDGVVKKGTILKHGDPIIVAYAPKALKTTDIHLGKLSKALGNAFKDLSETWDFESDGEVTDVAKQGSLMSVNVRTKRALNIGDKISIGYGNKGVTGLILPDTQAPTDKEGKPVDIILNSMSITSRVSPALISTLGVGKVAKKLGKIIKITPFIEGSSIKKTEELMAKHGVEGVEELYDPVSGTNIKALVGPLFFNRLVHISEDKLSTRSQGVSYDWDQQPTKGDATESAKRLGNLSTTALLSHNAVNVLRDIATVRATKNDEFWRNLKLGLPAPAPKVPFVFEKFIGSLQGAGIKVKREGDKFQVLPQTDKEIIALSQGPITNAKTFKVKGQNLIPEKGGLFDPNNTGIFGTNYNHIDLHYSVPNPISEDPLRRMLKLTKEKYENAIMSGDLVKQLNELDVDKKIEEYKRYIKTGKVSDRSNAVKVLAFLNTLKANNMHPKDLILTKVPVIPAQFRPVQVAGDLTLSANVNHLYKDLILNNDKIPDLKYAPEELANKTKLTQYQAVKAIYGLGDPVSIKNKEKSVKGLLAEMLGTHGGSAKGSVFQAKVVNKPLDLIGRGVATGDVKLDLNEISIPQDIAWKIFSPFLIRRLVRKGVPATLASEYVKNRNPLANQALHEEMTDRPVVMSRDPALHKFNLMGFMPKINPDPKNKTVSVNPLVFKGFNLDLDGDQVSVSTPAGEDAKEEIKEKMLPSKNLLTIKSFSPIYVPSNEAALGLYQASTEDNKNEPVHFDTEQEAINAYQNGQLHVGDRVKIKNK